MALDVLGLLFIYGIGFFSNLSLKPHFRRREGAARVVGGCERILVTFQKVPNQIKRWGKIFYFFLYVARKNVHCAV